jgi:dATP pyrophosphohydrolase
MIPINTNLVGCHIIRYRPKAPVECLILKRSAETGYYPGLWQIVTGHIQESETAIQAVLREITEETRLNPLALYSLNSIGRFYEPLDNSIYLVPLFLAVVPHSSRVVLNPKEHDRYQWCNFQEALKNLAWPQHRRSLTHIRREFIEREPLKVLKVYEFQSPTE